MLIGIDIDGVLFPWADACNEALVAKFGIVDPGPHVVWDWPKRQVGPEEWEWLWTPEGRSVVFGQVGRTYPGAVEQFDRILGSGHECHFVTHRDPSLTALLTAEFLTRHFGHRRWEGFHVLKSSMPKHALAEWDVFVDDKPATVEDMLLFTRAHVFSPRRPWNTELECWLAEPTFRRRFTYYDDPAQVAEWVLAR